MSKYRENLKYRINEECECTLKYKTYKNGKEVGCLEIKIPKCKIDDN